MRRVAMMLIVVALAAACGSTAETTTSSSPPSSATTASAGGTMTPPTASTTTAPSLTTTTTITPGEAALPALLVLGRDGISVWEDGVETALWSGSAEVAFPDGAGGTIVGLTRERSFEWDRTGGVMVPTPPRRDHAVLAVSASGEVTGLLPESPDAIDQLVQVAELGRRQVAVLYRSMGGPPCCDDPDVDPMAVETSIVTHLVLRDLTTGREDYLGIVGDFESSHYRFRFSGDTVAISWEPYGGGRGGLGWLPLAAFAPDDPWPEGPWKWLAETCFDAGCFTHGPVATCATDDCAGYVTEPALAADASAIAFVEVMERYGPEGSVQDHPDVVVIEIPSGEERLRVTLDQIEPNTNSWPSCIDFDGSSVLVSFAASGGGVTNRTFLIRPDGSVELIPVAGMARFWTVGPIGS